MALTESFYRIDTTEWPLVRILFPDNPTNSEQFERFLEDCKIELYGMKGSTKVSAPPRKQIESGGTFSKRFVLFVDPYGLNTWNITYLYRIAQFMKEMEPMTKEFMIELGIHVPSSLVRSIIDMIKKLKTPVVPWQILANRKEVDAWIEDLENRQILFPVS